MFNAVVLAGPQGRVVSLNHPAETLFGRRAGEAVGQPLASLFGLPVSRLLPELAAADSVTAASGLVVVRDLPGHPSARLHVRASRLTCGTLRLTYGHLPPADDLLHRDRGTGMGLATVEGIVRQSGGHKAVQSAAGRAASADGHAGVSVLLVEDEEIVRQLAHQVLARHGHRVVSASDGAEALRLAADPAVGIDVLLTDVVMPDMRGHELANTIRRTRPGIAVVLMSGYPDEAALGELLLETHTAFLPKPFTSDRLLACLKDALAGGAKSAT